MDTRDQNSKRTSRLERDKGQIKDKIKKLTEALYRVTDLYNDKEPLKWALRENAIFIYHHLLSSEPSWDKKISNSFDEIVKILDLASLGGFISDINFEILKKEYQKIKIFIESYFPKEKIYLDFNFGQELPILIDKGQNSLPPHLSISGEDKGHPAVSGIKDKKNKNKAQEKSEIRKQKIINFLKENGKKTIKEIALIFEGISNKSIQRDLADLVKEGALSGEGEKRWRLYFISNIDNNSK
ncbi:MAG: hypothetical protein ABIJ28_00255 [Patescibacteria group bacterium]|nr:hypothetical protein [Patescibacteria group bacterium]